MRTAITFGAVFMLGMIASARGETILNPAGAEADVVSAACATCHSLAYIKMNAHFLPIAGWKAEVTKMRTIFGAPIDDDAADKIVAWLAAHYGVLPAK